MIYNNRVSNPGFLLKLISPNRSAGNLCFIKNFTLVIKFDYPINQMLATKLLLY